MIPHRHNSHSERGNGRREGDAPVIVVLLDGGTDDTGDANTVAAHFHDLGLTLLIEEGATQRLGVFGAQLEDVADFNAAHDVQHPFAVRRGVARDHIADIGDFRLRQVAAKVGTGEVHVVFISATGKIGHHGDRAIGNDADARLDANGADKARDAAQGFFDLVFTGEAEGTNAVDLAGLDFIELMVATQEQQNQVA